MGIFNIKSGTVGTLGCGQALTFESPSGAGTYYIDVELTEDTGIVVLDYDSYAIPDRFQLEWNGSIVADSKLVGDHLSGNPPDADTTLWESGGGTGQFVGHVYNTIPDLEWNGSSFTATGSTTNNTVLQSDVAPFGETAGRGEINFNKNTALPSTIRVIVTSFPDNTGWDFTINCPLDSAFRPIVMDFGPTLEESCGQGIPQDIYVPIDKGFTTTDVIWSTSNGTGVPAIGWYSYKDESRYWDGVSSFSVPSICDVTPPSNPSYSSLSNTYPNTIILNPSTDNLTPNNEIQYFLERASDAQFTVDLVTVKNWEIGANALDDVSPLLQSGNTYYYRLKARDNFFNETENYITASSTIT